MWCSPPRCKRSSSHRLELETDLRAAVGSDQFFLAYQPIFDLEARTPSPASKP